MIPEWPKRGMKREPLITYDELCTKLGINRYQLLTLLRDHPGLRPQIVTRTNMNTNSRPYYRWSEAKAWYAGVLAAQKAETP